MPNELKELPKRTMRNLAPPAREHVYFERFQHNPFKPGATAFEAVNAWWLAEASLLAYGNESFITTKLSETEIAQTVMDVKVFGREAGVAQCLVANNVQDRFIVAAFRGTRFTVDTQFFLFDKPIVNVSDLLTDLKAIPVRTDSGGHVHQGFNEALDEIWTTLKPHLDAIRSGGGGTRTVWFTGHSMGAALATLAADRFGGDLVQGLYTFGSPPIGDVAFREQFRQRFPAGKCFRLVNNQDVVPHLLSTSPFGHVGELRFIDSANEFVDDPSRAAALVDQASREFGHAVDGVTNFIEFAARHPSLLRPRLPGFIVPDFLADHAPINYAVRVWNNYVKHEGSGR